MARTSVREVELRLADEREFNPQSLEDYICAMFIAGHFSSPCQRFFHWRFQQKPYNWRTYKWVDAWMAWLKANPAEHFHFDGAMIQTLRWKLHRVMEHQKLLERPQVHHWTPRVSVQCRCTACKPFVRYYRATVMQILKEGKYYGFYGVQRIR